MSNLIGSRVSQYFTVIPPRSDVMRQDLLSTAVTVEAPAKPAVFFEQDNASVGGSFTDSEDEFDLTYGDATFQQEEAEEEEHINMESPESEGAAFQQEEAALAEKYNTFQQMTRSAIRQKAANVTRSRENAIVEKLWAKYLASGN